MNALRNEIYRLRARLSKALNHWDLLAEATGLEKSKLSALCGSGHEISVAEALLVAEAIDALPAYVSLRWYLNLAAGQTERLAEAMNVSPLLIKEWADGTRPLPMSRAYDLERQTLGLVSAGRWQRQSRVIDIKQRLARAKAA